MTNDRSTRLSVHRPASVAWLATCVVSVAIGLAPKIAGAEPLTQPLTDPTTALGDYLAFPDDAYDYEVEASDYSGDGYSTHILRMVSQQWRIEAEASPAIWRHDLIVIVPDEIEHQSAALLIAGGSRDSEPPSADDEDVSFGARLAVLSGTPVAVLMQVPEQPVSFPDEPRPHTEDELVAYSWDKAIETGDYSWPVYVPMVKAAVRAMDTVQAFVPTVVGTLIEDFVVMGGSKRGAATWLTGAADDRVKAIAPLVIDITRFDVQMEHHLAVYGGYAPSIHDYVDYNLVQRVDTPAVERLRQVVDPWNYRRVLDMPKYIVNSSGDQFFPPDSAKFYFSALRGENLLRYLPNSDHSLSNSDGALIDGLAGLFSWYLAIVEGLPRPEIEWQMQSDGRLVVTSSPEPIAARLWTAQNPEARDFRLETIGEAWTSTDLSAASDGRYEVSPSEPDAGWRAYFVELAYPSARPGLCQVYSTRVFVTPEVRPFEGLTPDMLEGDPIISARASKPAGGGAPRAVAQGIFDDAADFADDLAGSILEDVHQLALEEAFGDEVDGRAVELCAAQSLDEFDDLIELYVLLGTGQSFDDFAGDQLEALRDEARGFGESLWMGADDFIDDAIDDVGDFADDAADDIDDFADDAVDDVDDFADDVVDDISDLF